MALLVEEAEKLSMEDKQRGVIEEIIDRDELFALVPFVRSKDKVYSYVREGELPTGDWYDAYEDIEESAAKYIEVETKLKVLAGQVDIDNFTAETQSELNDQVALQLAAKAKGLGRKFRMNLVTGDTSVNPKQFDGVRKLVTADQTLDAGADGNPISYAALDELKDMVKLGADVIMMRSGTWRAIRELNRIHGGNTAETMMIKNFGMPVKCYDGTPVIINDFIPADEKQGSATATTSVYALRLNEADGFHGLYGGNAAGIRIDDLGLLEKRDARRWRLRWYCGAALKATHSLARLKGVTNV